VLRNVKLSGEPYTSLASNYLAAVDEDACVGCGDCVDRCQMDAISMDEETAHVREDRCVGCGVCVPTCPSDALSLTGRSDSKQIPRNFRELIERQAAG
jgi:heterodisulfide reductase subunit A-like polyferredoxin